MCGIVGAAAQRNVSKILLEGIKRLEYRGYDSAGMAIVAPKTHEIQCLRALGKVSQLEDALNAHLLISKSSVRKDLLQGWLDNEKVFDLLALRPLFDQAGGKKLRKIASAAYQDANTWWYDVISNPENIFDKDAF